MINAYQSILIVMRQLFIDGVITRTQLSTFIDKFNRIFKVDEKLATSYMKIGDDPQAYCSTLNNLLQFNQVYVRTDKSDGFRKARVHFATLAYHRDLILELDLNYVMQNDIKIHFYENGTKVLTLSEIKGNDRVRKTIISLLTA